MFSKTKNKNCTIWKLKFTTSAASWNLFAKFIYRKIRIKTRRTLWKKVIWESICKISSNNCPLALRKLRNSIRNHFPSNWNLPLQNWNNYYKVVLNFHKLSPMNPLTFWNYWMKIPILYWRFTRFCKKFVKIGCRSCRGSWRAGERREAKVSRNPQSDFKKFFPRLNFFVFQI